MKTEQARCKLRDVRSRLLIWSVVIFQSLWLNVIVPGHARGVVQLAGAPVAQSSGPICCCCEKQDNQKKSEPGPARTCAICSFAAHMGLLPTIDLSLAPLRLLCRVKNYAAICLIPRLVQIPFDGRGPPVVA